MTSAGKSGDGAARLPDLKTADWLISAETQSVFSALAGGGFEGRAVGGAVRNALMGVPVKDVDIATPAQPDEVMRLAARAGLKAVATGIEHGTVTVVANHVPYEVTTLRRDIETFGRHARVTYTKDWAEDAQRRDFTINALYCARDGTVHDPLGGYADIAERRVRFIAEARDRIREDYLRILRFFRFTAEYARGVPDAAGLAAATELASGITSLSSERIRAELLRLLTAPAAVPTLAVMQTSGILGQVLPLESDTAMLARLVEIEAALGRGSDPILRLAALTAARPGDALALRDRLRLSSDEYERLARSAMPDLAFEPDRPEHDAKVFIYRHGSGTFVDGALLAWARSNAAPTDPLRRNRIELPSRWQAPACPVRGADILALGVAPGPEVGRIMSRFEDWWIAENFPLNANRLAAELHRLTLVTKS